MSQDLLSLRFVVVFFALLSSSFAVEPESHEFIRLIPDQRVPLSLGIDKITVFNLAEAYQALKESEEQTLLFELEQKGNSNVAAVSIENEHLTLNWNNFGKTQIILRIVNQDNGRVYLDRINLEAWQPDYLSMLFCVLGGLGIFLVGMRYMSDGLQNIAGSTLRNLIAMATNNRFLAVCIGFVVTVLVQSSSVCTVMVVGFVNSQIMTLTQAIGVIMGSNIGTTMTGWLLTLQVSKYGLPVVGAAAIVYLFSKSEKTRFIAMSCMGIGFIFFGMELMSQGFAPLREIQGFSEWMSTFSADTYVGVLLCVLVGCVLTMIVQASAATLAITISLAAIGVINFETGAALVLGENIGTTITALLACIGTSVNARRAAVFHALFNILGVLWVTTIFHAALIPLISSIVGVDDAGLIRDPKIGIALTHSLFNISNTIVFLPFTNLCAAALLWIIPDPKIKDAEKESPLLHHVSLLSPAPTSPTIGLERSRIEVIRMGHTCLQLASRVKKIVDEQFFNQEAIEAAFLQEEFLDFLQDEVIKYTTSLLSGNISHDISDTAQQQLRMADELESISDYLITILKSNRTMHKDGLMFPDVQRESVKKLHDNVYDFAAMIIQFYETRKRSFGDFISEVRIHSKAITRMAKDVRTEFIQQLMKSDVKYDPRVVVALNTQLSAYRRIREHAKNVAEAIAGAK